MSDMCGRRAEEEEERTWVTHYTSGASVAHGAAGVTDASTLSPDGYGLDVGGENRGKDGENGAHRG
jgi:hypothetical protein